MSYVTADDSKLTTQLKCQVSGYAAFKPGQQVRLRPSQVSSPSGVHCGSVRLAGDRIFKNIGVSDDGRLAFLTIDRCPVIVLQ